MSYLKNRIGFDNNQLEEAKKETPEAINIISKIPKICIYIS